MSMYHSTVECRFTLYSTFIHRAIGKEAALRYGHHRRSAIA
ncbi:MULTISPECIES: hypothetical protein [unclassified Saccharibacter]|nr:MULTISPECIES: hypothetical protein [unclassified Saccharibacter]